MKNPRSGAWSGSSWWIRVMGFFNTGRTIRDFQDYWNGAARRDVRLPLLDLQTEMDRQRQLLQIDRLADDFHHPQVQRFRQ